MVEKASDGLRERLGLTAWNGVHGRVGEQSPLTQTEQGLPFMSVGQQPDDDSASAYALETGSDLNLDSLRAQIDADGYCIVPNAVGGRLRAALLARLEDQAAAEAQAGVGSEDGDGAQQVLTLFNKGVVRSHTPGPLPSSPCCCC